MNVIAHSPVLLNEVLDQYAFDAPAVFVDGTAGQGGHTEALLDRFPSLSVLAIDRDPNALETAGARLSRFGSRVELIHSRFSDIVPVLQKRGVSAVGGALFDLGINSAQMLTPERGFSCRLNGPLDCRMDPTEGITAWQLLNERPVDELADGIRRYGDEPRAIKIARALKDYVRSGGRNDTAEIAGLIATVAPAGRLHPATLTFQALRMMVNDEIPELSRMLADVPGMLAPGGRVCVITFHSGEDRVVKNEFRKTAQTPGFQLVNRKVIRPGREEIRSNPRSRSAKLRVLERSAS